MPLIIESECITINLGRTVDIPDLRIVLVGYDLKDRDRLWRGTQHLQPRTVAGTGPHRIVEFLRENSPVDVVVLDLDAGGAELLDGVERARNEGLLPSRVLGYFSHVREDVGAAAAAAGVRPYPRSRFWRELPSLLGDLPS